MIGKPLVVGIGCTASPASSTERALSLSLAAAEEAGATTMLFGAAALTDLPHYGIPGAAATPAATMLLDAVRRADGVILASPGYHGSIAGLVKNAIDYFEETAKDARPYLDGLPVGLIATAYGWQAAVNTLGTLRTICHALRGWPTPLGAAVNCLVTPFAGERTGDPAVDAMLQAVGRQVAQAAIRWDQRPSEL